MHTQARAGEAAAPSAKAAIAALLFGGWLAWRGGLAGVAVARELAAVEPQRLVVALSWSTEQRIEGVLGARYEIERAVRAHVPPGATVAFHRTDRQDEYLFLELRTLLFPRRLVPPPLEMTPEWRPPAHMLHAGVFLLDLAPQARLDARADFETVAQGAGWSLLRARPRD